MERNGVEEIERKKEEVIKETNSRKGKKRKEREGKKTIWKVKKVRKEWRGIAVRGSHEKARGKKEWKGNGRKL